MTKRVAALALAWIGLAAASFGADCFETVSLTRSYGLGQPVSATPTPDGKSVLFLRSGPRDTNQRLYVFDIASHKTRELISPEALLGGKDETLSPEEKARRERARVSVKGFTFFRLSKDGRQVLIAQAGKLFVVGVGDGKVITLPGSGWMAPEWSPDGHKIAALKDHDIHVIDVAGGKDSQITFGANETLWHGEAEFVAQEEMHRQQGFWWSPDSQFIAYEEADLTPVEPHYIADPLHPEQKPVGFRYPRAGTDNAIVRLGVVPASGGKTVWVPWDNKALPYLGRVTWSKGAPLSLVVENREQTEEKLLVADPKTGVAHAILTERDAAWIDLEAPTWLDNGRSFLWLTERNGQRQLELHEADGTLKNSVTPVAFRVDALLDIDSKAGTAIISGGLDPKSVGIYRIALSGGAPQPIAASDGVHSATFGHQHDIFAHSYGLKNGQRGVNILSRKGSLIAELPSVSEAPAYLPKPEYFTVGAHAMDALVIKPRDFDPAKKYPVILSVYGGPAAKLVWNNPQRYFTEQCMADRGYIVAIADNRGTPGRDSAWFRAIKNNAIDIPLADQVEALQGLGAKLPQMDLKRVGVVGWSFGGYFSAMAVMRRPDIFAAGIAGAPVADWQDYDTFYTERYMGLPQKNAEGYKISNALSYGDQLQRPLLIVHGLTDDNVYFQNTVKLSLALLRAGKPYELLLLPGTHMLADNELKRREAEKQMEFFATHLGGPR